MYPVTSATSSNHSNIDQMFKRYVAEEGVEAAGCHYSHMAVRRKAWGVRGRTNL